MNNITKVPMELFNIESLELEGKVLLPQIPQKGELIRLETSLYLVVNIEYGCSVTSDEDAYEFEQILIYVKNN